MISPRVYHPPSSQYYYHQVDISAGERLIPQYTIHPVVIIIITRWIPLQVDDQSQRIPSTQQSVFQSLGGHLCWWTISPREYHPPSSQYIITRWIPLLVDDQSQRIPSTQQSVLLSLGGYLCWWTISPREYLPPSSQYIITRWIPLLVDDQSQRIPSTQQSVLLSLGGHLYWWTINTREYHPSSSHYYYHQVDTSAGGRLIPEDTNHPVVSITITGWIPLLVDDQSQWIQSTQQSVLQSLGAYLCWWTISPRGYHPPNSQYYYHQVDTSAGGLLVPVDTIHSVVSNTITGWIPLLVDDQSQWIPSTQQSVLQSLGVYLCWWTISPRGYHLPNSQYYYHQVDTSAGGLLVPEDTIHPVVSTTITRWIPLLVDYQSQRIPSTQQSVYYHQVDTSAGGRLVPENTIHPVVSILSLGGYLCWWMICTRGYHPPSSQYYYHQVDTSVGGLSVPENTIHPVVSILTLGGYLC